MECDLSPLWLVLTGINELRQESVLVMIQMTPAGVTCFSECSGAQCVAAAATTHNRQIGGSATEVTPGVAGC